MLLKFGKSPVLVASSPHMAKQFLKVHDANFATRPSLAAGKYTAYNYSDMTWAPYGPHWRQARKIFLSEVFNAKRLEFFEPIRVEERRIFLSRLHSLSGKPVVLRDHLSHYTLSNISRMVLSNKYFSEKEDDHHHDSIFKLHELQGMLDEWFLLNGVINIGDWIPWLSFLDLQGYVKRMKELHKKLDKFIEFVIDDHQARRAAEKGFPPKDVVDMLLVMAEKPNLEVKLTRDCVKALLQGKKVVVSITGEQQNTSIFGHLATGVQQHDFQNKGHEMAGSNTVLDSKRVDDHDSEERALDEPEAAVLVSVDQELHKTTGSEDEVDEEIEMETPAGDPTEIVTAAADLDEARNSEQAGELVGQQAKKLDGDLDGQSKDSHTTAPEDIDSRISRLEAQVSQGMQMLVEQAPPKRRGRPPKGMERPRVPQNQEDSIKSRLRNAKEMGQKPRDFVIDHSGSASLRVMNNIATGRWSDEMEDLLSGGTDTSATTIEWAMNEVLRHPGVAEKAREELDRVIGRKRWVEESDYSELPYINAIIMESWRLHPLSPLLPPHCAMEDCEVAGYDIAKGTAVIINTWSIGRDPKAWDAPEEFLPERFVGEDIDMTGSNFSLLPFGSGRRRCPGYKLGLKIVGTMLANLLHGFEMRLVEGMRPQDICVEELYGLTVHPKECLQLIMEPRLSPHLY